MCEDEGKLEQALQHYSSAIALNPACHLAIKNRADVRMAYANRLKEADARARAAAGGWGTTTSWRRWTRPRRAPTTFRAGGRSSRLEHRVTGAKVEGNTARSSRAQRARPGSINHTHVGAAYDV